MAGLAQSKAELDNRIGNAVVALAKALEDIVVVANMVGPNGRFPTATRTTMGYTVPENNTIDAGLPALANLRNVAYAQATVTAVNDFFFDAKNLQGVQL